MNKQTVLDLIDETVAELLETRAAVESGLIVRIRDGWHGHPRSPSFEAGAAARPRRPTETLPDELRGSLDYNDPVGAVVAATEGRDAAQKDSRALVGGLTMIRVQTRRVRDIRVRYAPRHASLFDQQETKEPEPGCVSCSRVDGPGSVGLPKSQRVPWWNEVHTTTTLEGKTWDLCRWCWEGEAGVKRTGSIPDVHDVCAYRDTGRARKKGA